MGESYESSSNISAISCRMADFAEPAGAVSQRMRDSLNLSNIQSEISFKTAMQVSWWHLGASECSCKLCIAPTAISPNRDRACPEMKIFSFSLGQCGDLTFKIWVGIILEGVSYILWWDLRKLAFPLTRWRRGESDLGMNENHHQHESESLPRPQNS